MGDMANIKIESALALLNQGKKLVDQGNILIKEGGSLIAAINPDDISDQEEKQTLLATQSLARAMLEALNI